MKKKAENLHHSCLLSVVEMIETDALESFFFIHEVCSIKEKGILDFLSSVGYSDQIREPMSINDKRSSEQNDSHKKLINGEYTISEDFFSEEKSIDLVFTLTKGDLKIDVLIHDPSQSNGGQISILIYNTKDFDYFKHLEGIKENKAEFGKYFKIIIFSLFLQIRKNKKGF